MTNILEKELETLSFLMEPNNAINDLYFNSLEYQKQLEEVAKLRFESNPFFPNGGGFEYRIPLKNDGESYCEDILLAVDREECSEGEMSVRDEDIKTIREFNTDIRKALKEELYNNGLFALTTDTEAVANAGSCSIYRQDRIVIGSRFYKDYEVLLFDINTGLTLIDDCLKAKATRTSSESNNALYRMMLDMPTQEVLEEVTKAYFANKESINPKYSLDDFIELATILCESEAYQTMRIIARKLIKKNKNTAFVVKKLNFRKNSRVKRSLLKVANQLEKFGYNLSTNDISKLCNQLEIEMSMQHQRGLVGDNYELVISMKPSEIMTMSTNNKGWHSCMEFGGAYGSTALYYPFIKNSFVVYVTDGSKLFEQSGLIDDKLWRVNGYFNTKGECAIHSTQYPYQSTLFIKQLQKALEECLPEYYTIPSEEKKSIRLNFGDCRNFNLKFQLNNMYFDAIETFSLRLSKTQDAPSSHWELGTLDGYEVEYETIFCPFCSSNIGAPACDGHCTECECSCYGCGIYISEDNLTYVDALDMALCEDCYEERVKACDDCGRVLDTYDMVQVDDENVCVSCYHARETLEEEENDELD